MKPRVAMRQASSDPNLLGNALPGDSWKPWRTLLIAMMGEPLTDDERVLFKELTGRDREPGVRCEEFVAAVGRRGGKTEAAATLVVYVSGCCEHPELVPGEIGTCLIIAADQEQATICLNRIEAKFRTSPLLKQLIASTTAKQIRLTNGIVIQVRASDYRRVRGTTLVCAIGDECCFWTSAEGGNNPDTEIVAALRPALATTSGMLALISSPYAKRGELHSLYKKHYGPAGDPLILVAKAATRVMNPSLPQSVIDRAYERDPVVAAAECGAEFRSDVSNYIDREIIDACVAKGMFERLAAASIHYSAFVDPSGGSSDSYTCAIGHRDASNGMVYVDAVRELRAPFSPEIATAELSVLLKSYRVSKVFGDHYAGAWPAEAFGKHGIGYEGSALPKSQLYSAFLPLLNSGMVELPDNPRLINQLASLERRTARGGRDSIDHPAGGGHHDDVANVVAGFAVHANDASANYSALVERVFNAEEPEINPRPKRFHPNLTEEQFKRITAPPPLIPMEVISHHERRMAQERQWLAEILASRVTSK
jgi:hypothetical protein